MASEKMFNVLFQLTKGTVVALMTETELKLAQGHPDNKDKILSVTPAGTGYFPSVVRTHPR